MTGTFDWAEIERGHRLVARRVARGIVREPALAAAVVAEAFAAVRASALCGERAPTPLGRRRVELLRGVIDRAALAAEGRPLPGAAQEELPPSPKAPAAVGAHAPVAAAPPESPLATPSTVEPSTRLVSVESTTGSDAPTSAESTRGTGAPLVIEPTGVPAQQASAESASPRALSRDAFAELAREAARLEATDRAILRHWLADGLGFEATADRLHLALVTVEERLARALGRLRPGAAGIEPADARALAELCCGRLDVAAARETVDRARRNATLASALAALCALAAAGELDRERVFHAPPEPDRRVSFAAVALVLVALVGWLATRPSPPPPPIELGAPPPLALDDPALASLALDGPELARTSLASATDTRPPLGDLELRARELHAAGDAEAVIALLAPAAAARRENPRLALLHADALLRARRPEESAGALLPALASADPRVVDAARWLLGHARWASGDREAAETAWRELAASGRALAAEAREALRLGAD